MAGGKVSKNAKVNRVADAESKNFVKVIKPVKNESGSYSFLEQILHKDKVKDFFAKK
jgi:hypothetical protein